MYNFWAIILKKNSTIRTFHNKDVNDRPIGFKMKTRDQDEKMCMPIINLITTLVNIQKSVFINVLIMTLGPDD